MGRCAEGLSPVLKQLRNHHRSMARDFVSGGLRPGELAGLYNMQPAQISIITNSPLFIAECCRLEEEAEDDISTTRQSLQLLAPRAKQVITEELFAKAETMSERRLRLGVATDLLDRVGIHKKIAPGAVHLHKHDEIHIETMTDDQLQKDVFDLLD